DRPAEVEVLEVTPGMHAVEVTTPCGDAKTDIQVEAQQTVTVGVGDFSGLTLATLALTFTAPSGEKPSPTATLTLLDEARSVDREDRPWPVPQAVFSGGATVPACDLRLKVASGVETLGGYWEDLTLTAGMSVSREVRLAPGPD